MYNCPMVKISLARFGKKGSPFYRIVAVERGVKRSGKFLEVIGTWNPINKKLDFDKKLFEKWMAQGAQTTEGVDKLLKQK